MGRDCCHSKSDNDGSTVVADNKATMTTTKTVDCCNKTHHPSGAPEDRKVSSASGSHGGGDCCWSHPKDGNHHSHDHHNHDEEDACSSNRTSTTSSSLCLAVIRESGADVILFDKSGVPRTFRYNGTKEDFSKLCFDSHGMDGWMSHQLTPCFDEDGNHGNPEGTQRRGA
jgi:hypothetical protein